MKPRLRARLFSPGGEQQSLAHLDATLWGEISFYILGTPILRLIAHAVDNQQVLQALKRLRAKSDMDAVRSALVGLSGPRSEEHTSELQSLTNLVCRLLLEKKKQHKANEVPRQST